MATNPYQHCKSKRAFGFGIRNQASSFYTYCVLRNVYMLPYRALTRICFLVPCMLLQFNGWKGSDGPPSTGGITPKPCWDKSLSKMSRAGAHKSAIVRMATKSKFMIPNLRHRIANATDNNHYWHLPRAPWLVAFEGMHKVQHREKHKERVPRQWL